MSWYSIEDNFIDFRADIRYLKVLEAAEITVKKVMNNYPPPYHLMVSGGIDSQAVMYMWKLFGKNYIPTSVIYNNDFNLDDLSTLPLFCSQNNIEVFYKDFDAIKFYENEYEEFAEQYKCVSPHFATHLAMTDDLSGTVIFSGDFIQNISALHQRGTINPGNYCLYTAAKTRSIVPFFFIETPELAYSYLYEVLNYFPEPASTTDLYLNKVVYYQKFGLPVIMQDQKYTGFEKIKDYYDENHRDRITPQVRINYRLNHSPRTYDLLFRYPYERKYGYSSFKFKFNKVIKNVR